MTMFDFLEFFEHQMVFIGECGTKFIFLVFFLNFLTLNDKKIKFVFKRSHSYSNDQI
jgi:hypothetical protein